MKVGGKNGLTKNQFRNLILNLQEIAHQLNEAKQENEKQENTEDKENEWKSKKDCNVWCISWYNG